ncbi:MAG: hypothetical protein K2O74_00180, partial [Eubacteriales bacterium]|nr:hypothetical protein [Eubacteriales bacterium]
GGARIFASRYVSNDPDIQLAERANRPEAVVEAFAAKPAKAFLQKTVFFSIREIRVAHTPPAYPHLTTVYF